MGEITASICVSGDGALLLDFVAEELERLLVRLFAIRVSRTAGGATESRRNIILGLVTDRHVQRAAGKVPELSEQGFLLRRVGPETMVIAGGSPAAVCWAVYEFAERFGVRYLLHEDVFPEEAGALELPPID